MNIWRRIKNLWRLSEYHPSDGPTIAGNIIDTILKKDFPTIQKKPVTIIPEKVVDVFAPEQDDTTS